MATLQIAYNSTTKVATVQTKGDALPAGSTLIAATVPHDTEGDILGVDENHVLYHHVQEALYHIGQQNMQEVRIDLDITYVAVAGVTSLPATVTLAVAATQQITNTVAPVGASNTAVTYSTSDATKATVSATGLITGVAVGTATITITTVDGGLTDTVAVTVE